MYTTIKILGNVQPTQYTRMNVGEWLFAKREIQGHKHFFFFFDTIKSSGLFGIKIIIKFKYRISYRFEYCYTYFIINNLIIAL